MKMWILLGLGLGVLAIVTFLAVNKVSPVSWGMWGDYNSTSGLGLKGYDPVSYLDGGKPVRGDSSLTTDWGGVTWQFANQQNRDAFRADPERYAPQYGGFCAFAVSKGFTADSSPDAWHIEDGHLFVFADQKVRDLWVETMKDGSLNKSNTNWGKRR